MKFLNLKYLFKIFYIWTIISLYGNHKSYSDAVFSTKNNLIDKDDTVTFINIIFSIFNDEFFY